MTKVTDLLSPELRSIEAEVDSHYKNNLLVEEEFAVAAWHLLAFAENTVIMPRLRGDQISRQTDAAMADNLVNGLHYPLYWLHSTCSTGGSIPFSYSEPERNAAKALLDLGKAYRAFVAAFTYASRGIIGLTLSDSTLQPTDNIFANLEYEAYNRLIKPSRYSSFTLEGFPVEAIRYSLRVNGNRFTYKLTPRLVSDAMHALKPLVDQRFVLPKDWQFSGYTLGDFQRVFESIVSIAFIHFVAKMMAADQGCIALGYVDSIYLPTYDELLRRIVRYSGVSEKRVATILGYLLFGSKGILIPDLSLQPLIKLNPDSYAIMPTLWFSSSAERNLTVLLNKLPSEREVYLRLVSEKEEIMRGQVQSSLAHKDYRFIYGSIPGCSDLPDIDLALIDDREKACLLLELKWFIDPAEVREIVEKSEEIEKGISQLCRLRAAYREGRQLLLKKLGISPDYTFCCTVASSNWIGHASVQNSEVPVIQAMHLTKKMQTTDSLITVIAWLFNREYLPVEGKHFEVRRITATVGNWSVSWYGLRPLVDDSFLPL